MPHAQCNNAERGGLSWQNTAPWRPDLGPVWPSRSFMKSESSRKKRMWMILWLTGWSTLTHQMRLGVGTGCKPVSNPKSLTEMFSCFDHFKLIANYLEHTLCSRTLRWCASLTRWCLRTKRRTTWPWASQPVESLMPPRPDMLCISAAPRFQSRPAWLYSFFDDFKNIMLKGFASLVIVLPHSWWYLIYKS